MAIFGAQKISANIRMEDRLSVVLVVSAKVFPSANATTRLLLSATNKMIMSVSDEIKLLFLFNAKRAGKKQGTKGATLAIKRSVCGKSDGRGEIEKCLIRAIKRMEVF
jgi:hypothetical protein